jgi:alpha-glucan,water dikinase
LPAWIRLPPSIAVPFGVFVHVLSSEPNQRIAEQYNRLQASVEEDPPRYLPELRAAILKLHAPGDFPAALQQKAAEAGLPWPTKWEKAWRAIKQVWASKWNERAFHSRRTQGVAHADLCMAVLIQQVVDADYAFVIHSVNPFTGNRDELYSEIVVGLGETLVGNYPGRALSCLYHKQSKTPTLLSYPGKSSALRGCGLIFRSDSNGEDLAGYAGAGLYDSVLVPPPQQRLLDYSGEGLVWDESFRRGLLDRIAEIGLAFEELLGAPQDIEGMLAQGQYHVVQTRPQVGLGPA